MEQSRFRCGQRDPEYLGGLMQRAFLQLIEFDDPPKAWSQLCDRGSQRCFLLLFFANLFWIWRETSEFTFEARVERFGGVLQRNLAGYAMLPRSHQCGINRDPGEPCRKLCPSVKGIQVDVGTKKALLDHIFSILTMSNDPVSNPKHPFGVTSVKLVEDSSVAHLGDRNKPLVTNEFGTIACDGAPVPLVI